MICDLQHFSGEGFHLHAFQMPFKWVAWHLSVMPALCLPSEVSEGSMAGAQLYLQEMGGCHIFMGHRYFHARQGLP